MDRALFTSTFVAATALCGTALGQNQAMHDGLLHTALGQAQLSQVNGQLIVSNIGSSGLDGVRIDLGSSEWNTVEIILPDPDDLPSVGWQWKLWPEVSVPGLPQLVRPWTMCLDDIGSDYAIQFDPGPMQGTELRVDALLNGVVVDSVKWQQPQGGITTASIGPAICCADPIWNMGDEEWLILDLAGVGDVTLMNGIGTVQADQLIMAVSGSQIAYDSVAATVMTSTMPVLTLLEESIGQFGLAHSAEGQAILDAQGGRLKISNLGSSGCDGVSIDVGGGDTHWMELDPLPIQILPPGAYLEFTTFGAGLPQTDISNLRVEYVGGNDFGASIDLAPLAPQAVRVDLMLGGQLLQSQTLSPPPLPTDILVNFPPTGCQIAPFMEIGSEAWSVIDLPQPGPLSLPGQPSVIGDRVVIAAVGHTPPGALGATRRVLGGGGLLDFTLRGELPSFPEPVAYCTGKLNSQSCVPYVDWSGSPTLTGADDFVITAHDEINNKPGLFFHGNGTIAVPFFNGTLCVLPPLQRTPVQFSFGNPPPDDCSGTYQFAFTQAYMGLNGLLPGDTVTGQFWSRDTAHPDGTGVGLTNAIHFNVQP